MIYIFVLQHILQKYLKGSLRAPKTKGSLRASKTKDPFMPLKQKDQVAYYLHHLFQWLISQIMKYNNLPFKSFFKLTPFTLLLLAQGRRFSPDTLASSTTKTGRHDIVESGVKHQKLIKSSLFSPNVRVVVLIIYFISKTHVAPLGHIIMIPFQPVFALTP